MVTLAVRPGIARASLVVAKLANPGDSSGVIKLLVPQLRIVGLAVVALAIKLTITRRQPQENADDSIATTLSP
jgi:hypothetical protein